MRHGIDCSQSFEPLSVFASPAQLNDNPVAGAGSSDQISLRRLLPSARFFAGNDVSFSSMASSSESAAQGDLVVYRIGQDCPVKLVADAMSRGAAGILSEQLLPCPLPQCIVGDIDLALAEITSEQLQRPDRKLLTVGVVGSAGKTSTTLLVSSLLRSSGIRTAYQCDLGGSDGVVQSTSTDPVASGATLIEQIGEANDAKCRAAIIELSEDDARHGRYDAIQFDILVVTGSAICSGDFGPSGLQCLLERVTDDGVVIAAAEDVHAIRVILDADCNLLTYGTGNAADVTAKIIDQSGGMTTLLVTHQNTTAVMETPLCGAAMAANHAAAVMVGLLIDQPLEAVVERLGQLQTIPGRGQRLSNFSDACVVVDVGGSPDRAEMTLATHRAMKSDGRLWCVLAIDGNESPEFLARYGNLLERFAEHAIITARPETKHAFLAASHNVLDGVQKCASFRLVADRRCAIEWAVAEAQPSDTILVITSERNRSAVEGRSDIEQIVHWVDSARQADQPQEQSTSVKLSIYNG